MSQGPGADSKDDVGRSERLLRRYCHKVDWRILLYAMVLSVLNQCDRVSIGVAKVAGLEHDLGMTKNDFNIATTLFSVGFLAVEPFSNIVLKRVGASRLLPTLGVLWGAVCALQSAVRTRAQFFAMRTLLGVAECGFLSGTLMLLSFFYPRSRVTARIGLFYLCTPFSSAVSGPLATGLSQIRHRSIKRWQWIFLLEGAATVAVSLPGYFVLQDHPEKCRFLSAEEKEFIVEYKRREGSLGGSQQLTLREARRVLGDWQLWVMLFAVFAGSEMVGTVVTFSPEVINKLGFTSAQAQAMSALPAFCGFGVTLLLGAIVQRCRGHWLACSAMLGAALAGSVVMVATLNVPARIVGLCIMGGGGFPALAASVGWAVTANSQSATATTVAAAMTGLYAIAANFVSSNVFLNADAPRFVTGHTVNIAITAAGILACIVTRISMGRRNARAAERCQDDGDSGQPFMFAY
ncbi:hypothetical protein H4R18_003043 [Coemansia javaensis]|uniref:Major facilitator superfamily (MFS) profile domain-containing protein n=1 Tax=Coemansia javaensis TaxID=2761396 RepID=A0A9W8LIB3_9FUNG|nr:hypothetical protein H4R18_003043 [Coemansia javaensis]